MHYNLHREDWSFHLTNEKKKIFWHTIQLIIMKTSVVVKLFKLKILMQLLGEISLAKEITAISFICFAKLSL